MKLFKRSEITKSADLRNVIVKDGYTVQEILLFLGLTVLVAAVPVALFVLATL